MVIRTLRKDAPLYPLAEHIKIKYHMRSYNIISEHIKKILVESLEFEGV